MFRSVLDCRVAIAKVFCCDLISTDIDKPLLDIGNHKLRTYSVLQKYLEWQFWSGVLYVTPIFEPFAAVLRFLESHLAPLWTVTLALSRLVEFCKEKLALDQAAKEKAFLNAQYNAI